MDALVYDAPRRMSVRRTPVPRPGAGEVLVEVAYSGICGSELSGYLGQSSIRTPPLIFGHEVAGRIVDVGPTHALGGADGTSDLDAGTAVVVNPLRTCGRCRACMRGRQQLCPDRSLLGAHRPGSNAQYVVTDRASLLPLAAATDLRTAAMVEPAACALHAVRSSGVAAGDTALVVGAGPIGLLLLQVLLASGVTAPLVAELEPRRRAAAERLGAVAVAADHVSDQAREATDGRGVDLAVDAVGSPRTRQGCLDALARGGTLALVGLHTDTTELPLNRAVRDEIRLVGAFASSAATFADALAWVEAGRLSLGDGIVVASLDDGPEWFSRLVDGDPVTKVLLRPAVAA